MHLLWTYFSNYPRQSAIALLAILLSGIVEGVGLSALLPLLSIAMKGSGQPLTGIGETQVDSGGSAQHLIVGTLGTIGLQPTLGVLLAVVLVTILLKSGLLLLANKYVGYAVARVTTDLRLSLLRALFATRWEYFVRRPMGGLANAVATEASRGGVAYLHGTNMVALVLQAVVYTVVALSVDWDATLIALVAGGVFLYGMGALVRKTRRAGAKQTKLMKSLIGRLTDSLVSIKALKAMAREHLTGPLLEADTARLNRALQREVLSKEALKASQEPALALLVAGGAYLMLTVWTLPIATILVLAFLLSRVVGKLGKVQKEYQSMVACESAYWSLQDTIKRAQADREVTTGRMPPRFAQAIRLERVTFSYGTHTVLQDVSLSIPAGTFTAITGPSGAGKTTIADLITGLVRPQRGDVWIDEVALRDIDLRAWRRMIGYVPQETVLLHDTILNNIVLGDEKLTEKDAEEAVRAAGARDFVSAMPEGMHTIVGERGGRLSGGQRQRLAIARALVHRPRLLILDEATSALDPVTEHAICQTLRGLHGQLTVLIISHQSVLAGIADRAYRVQDGSVLELAQTPSGTST